MDVTVRCIDGTQVDLPGVSRATVDRVLDQFENGGQVLKFALTGDPERIVFLARRHIIGIEVTSGAEP